MSWRGPDCTALGLGCDNGTCVGTGAQCEASASTEVVTFRGASCTGNVLHACIGEHMHDVDCATLGPTTLRRHGAGLLPPRQARARRLHDPRLHRLRHQPLTRLLRLHPRHPHDAVTSTAAGAPRLTPRGECCRRSLRSAWRRFFLPRRGSTCAALRAPCDALLPTPRDAR
jgi:hypothetical protein